MADKIDNEISSPMFELKCPNCGSDCTFSDFVVSIVLNGLIVLNNPESVMFGCTCRFCNEATLIKKFSKEQRWPEEIAHLYNCIHKRTYWNHDGVILDSGSEASPIEYTFSGKWHYNSFPYLYVQDDSPDIGLEDEPSGIYVHIIRREFEKILKVPYFDVSNSKSVFYSYIRDCLDTQPSLVLMAFGKNMIDKLITLESAQKKKAFPRYTLYDPHIEEIQSFCSEYSHATQDVFNDFPLYNRNQKFLMKSKKKLIQQAYCFMDMLDKAPEYMDFIDPPDWDRGFLYEKLSGWDRYCASRLLLEQKKNSEQMLLPSRKDSLYLRNSERETIAQKVWDHFTKDYLQEILTTGAERFIFEFVELSKSISFSRNSVYDLKEKFLLEIHNAVRSKSQRRVEQQRNMDYWQTRAEEAEKRFSAVKILSHSPEINKLKVSISQLPKVIALKNFKGPILLLGEKGTGKTHFAKAIHHACQLKGEFIKLDCGSKSEELFGSDLFGHVKGAFTGSTGSRKGAFEMAKGGTLFLDEIGNISRSVQQKLLGVLNDKEYQPIGSSETKTTDAFIIAATNADLEKMVENGEFRGDLLDRLNKEPMTIPPLRERKMDIPLFFYSLMTDLPIDPNLEADLKKLKYDWPGNVRELISIIEGIERRKIMEDDTSPICFDDLPQNIKHGSKKSKKQQPNQEVRSKGPGNTKVTGQEVLDAMKKHNGNKVAAAKELNVSRMTIARHCKKLGV